VDTLILNFQIPASSNSIPTIEEWNKGNIPVLFAHRAAAVHGLNLQNGGKTVILFGPGWSLELYQQANARLYRQGQSEPVNVYHIGMENTIEEDVIKSLASRSSGQESLMNSIKSRLSGFAQSYSRS
jgi:SNF2 family DNA or RNA helicase